MLHTFPHYTPSHTHAHQVENFFFLIVPLAFVKVIFKLRHDQNKKKTYHFLALESRYISFPGNLDSNLLVLPKHNIMTTLDQ